MAPVPHQVSDHLKLQTLRFERKTDRRLKLVYVSEDKVVLSLCMHAFMDVYCLCLCYSLQASVTLKWTFVAG